MPFYIVDRIQGVILDVQGSMSKEIVQALADEFGRPVYAIEGQHSGYSAEPKHKEQDEDFVTDEEY